MSFSITFKYAMRKNNARILVVDVKSMFSWILYFIILYLYTQNTII